MATSETVTCVYCHVEMAAEDAGVVPEFYDDEAWAREAERHDRNCEWVKSRAHRCGPDSLALLAREQGATDDELATWTREDWERFAACFDMQVVW